MILLDEKLKLLNDCPLLRNARAGTELHTLRMVLLQPDIPIRVVRTRIAEANSGTLGARSAKEKAAIARENAAAAAKTELQRAIEAELARQAQQRAAAKAELDRKMGLTAAPDITTVTHTESKLIFGAPEPASRHKLKTQDASNSPFRQTFHPASTK